MSDIKVVPLLDTGPDSGLGRLILGWRTKWLYSRLGLAWPQETLFEHGAHAWRWCHLTLSCTKHICGCIEVIWEQKPLTLGNGSQTDHSPSTLQSRSPVVAAPLPSSQRRHHLESFKILRRCGQFKMATPGKGQKRLLPEEACKAIYMNCVGHCGKCWIR